MFPKILKKIINNKFAIVNDQHYAKFEGIVGALEGGGVHLKG